MARIAVPSQDYLYYNKRLPVGGSLTVPRGRWVNNLLGADADLTQWNEVNIPGTGTATITENGLERTFTATSDGTVRAFVGVTYASFDTAEWYAFGAECVSVTDIGTWTRGQIYFVNTPTDGENTVIITSAGRWCVIFQPSATSITLRLGIGGVGNETVVTGESITMKNPFLFELDGPSDQPAEWIGDIPAIVPYDNPCTVASNVITQAAYGSLKDYSRSDVILFAGDSFGNDASEYPVIVRETHQIEAHITHTSGNNLEAIGTQITDYIANPATNDPANLVAKVCVMNGGINDILQDTAVETMQSRLNANIAAVRAADMIPIVLSVGPWKAHASWSSSRQTLTDDYNAWLLARTDILTVDIYSLLEDPATADALLAAFDNGDGMHPTSLASTAIARKVINALEKLQSTNGLAIAA